MNIEVKKLNALKQYQGDFSFEYQAPENLLSLPLSSIEGKVKVYGSFEIYEDMSVGVLLNIEYLVKGQCSYCLKDAEERVSFKNDILFVLEDDADHYRYNGKEIDLCEAVNEAILFGQPDVLLCVDCKNA